MTFNFHHPPHCQLVIEERLGDKAGKVKVAGKGKVAVKVTRNRSMGHPENKLLGKILILPLR